MQHIHSSRSRRRRPAGSTSVVAIGILALAASIAALGARSERLLPRTPIAVLDSVPTFASDVAPILYRNCVSCHHPGGMGPFSLLDYDSATKKLTDIRDVIREGKMPPWHAVAPPGTFRNERGLTAEEKRTILRWLATGAQEGNPAAMPPKPTFPEGWTIGTPDAVFTMPEDYAVPARGTVEYQYFEVPTNFTEDKWVQAIEIMPGAREVVHHVLVFARAPQAPRPAAAQAGSPAAGAPAAPAPVPVLTFDSTQKTDDRPRADSAHAPPKRTGSLIGTTAPGTNVLSFPEGTALRIPAGAVLTFQMHYTAHGHAMKDRTSVGVRFAKERPAEQMIATHFFNGQFEIPPGGKDVMIPASVKFNEAVRVYGLFPHTHLRGTRWQYTLEKPDGSSEIILDVPHYDFNWQTYYLFAKPLEIPGGARIVAHAWYDNSADNESNPDPAIAVHWGDQTWEEMQYTGMLYSVNSRRVKATP